MAQPTPPHAKQTSADAAIDWNLEESSVFIPWDDGHTPETQPKGRPGLRIYPDYHHHHEETAVVVDPGVLAAASVTNNPQLADDIYEFTVQQPRPSWGSYVTMEEIDALLEQQQKRVVASSVGSTTTTTTTRRDENVPHCSNNSRSPPKDGNIQHDLALQAAALFLQTASTTCVAAAARTTRHHHHHHHHGVAVWGLSASTGSEVAYHMDYAEWIRYRDGVTILPVLAGTWQCTKAHMEGGALWIAKGGLEHYRRHGYKGALEPICLDDSKKDDWIQYPYKYNQMIVMAGHLPHLSTTVESIADPQQQRVIIGFNVFLHDAGPAIQQAPEHSTAFRTAVRRLQQQRRQLRLVQANPQLTRRLVEAKREKVKENFRIAQRKLDQEIEVCLMAAEARGVVRREELVQTLLERVGSSKGVWPCSYDDIRTHLLLRQKEGWLVGSDDGLSLRQVREEESRRTTESRIW